MTVTRLILLLTLATTGCQFGSRREDVAKIVKPALSTSIGRDELVDYLNRQNEGLQSWRCMNTQVQVRMPGLPLPQKLSGSIACAAPSQFRLVSDNMVAHADFGSNEEICWAYVKPGDPVVMTWRHEDSHLLQHFQGGLPRLEPDWLMTVLGVQPLDPDRYELQNSPSGSRELWLVAVENAADGTSLRRVIKVDSVQGVAREHALYDSNGKALLRAQLSNHKSCSQHLLPHTIRILFPQCETELTLNFKGIETDCQIETALWHPPHGRNMEVVDLGDVMRTRMQADPGSRRLPKDGLTAELPPTTPGSPRRPNLDSSPGPDQTDSLPRTKHLITYSKPEDDNRFFGNPPPDETHKDQRDPDWDEESELIPDEKLDEHSIGPDELDDEPQEDLLLAPDFDVVAPPQRSRSRRGWWPFRK